MTRYTVTDKEKYKSAYIDISVEISRPCTVLLTLPTYIAREAKIILNGVEMGTVNANNSADRSFINLGYVEESALHVQIAYGENDEGEFFLKNDDYYFYTPDDNAFAKLMEDFEYGTVESIKQTNNVIKVALNTPSDMKTIFTTLPYSEKTVVKVDGKKVETYAHLGAFLGFDLPNEGMHEISISINSEHLSFENAFARPVGYLFFACAVGHDLFVQLRKKKKEDTSNA